MAMSNEENQDPRDEINESEAEVSGEMNLADEQESSSTALVPFDSLQRYLSEIRRYSVLSREEEQRLAIEYKEFGNIKAAFRLVTSNLRLVVMIAREYEKALKNLLDLIQEGNIGLIEALKNFDPYRGVRFVSDRGVCREVPVGKTLLHLHNLPLLHVQALRQ